MNMMTVYDYLEYNREERDLCAHLFRLLLNDQKDWKPLKKFLGKDEVENPRIFCEVAIIRDGHFSRKPEIHSYMHDICELIAYQRQIDTYTRFDKLPKEIQLASKHLFRKLKEVDGLSFENNLIVYGTLQSMFNAKPDLVICEGNNLYVYEAKYVEKFKKSQIELTMKIAQIWSKLFYADLGFEKEPCIIFGKLGLEKYFGKKGVSKNDVSWEYIYEISKEFLGEDDFTTKVLSKVVK